MKKLCIIIALMVLCVASVFAFENESEYTYTNIPLSKVYNHTDGYVAMYTKDGYNMSTAYIPMKWFFFGTGKGYLINLPKGLYPYMTVVYKNGEFDHVTLAVPRNPADNFWGVYPNTPEAAAKFDVDTLQL